MWCYSPKHTHTHTHLTLAGPTRVLYDLLHSESGNVLAAHRAQWAARGSLWLVHRRISIVAANVTERHMAGVGQAQDQPAEEFAKTFTDLHNSFNWSFFGYQQKKKNKKAHRGLLVVQEADLVLNQTL